MPKTDFSNGTLVTSEYLDSMYFTGGGHRHDGINEDGHAQPINLSTEVAGQLPFGRLGSTLVWNTNGRVYGHDTDTGDGLPPGDIDNISIKAGMIGPLVVFYLPPFSIPLYSCDYIVIQELGPERILFSSMFPSVHFLDSSATQRQDANSSVIVSRKGKLVVDPAVNELRIYMLNSSGTPVGVSSGGFTCNGGTFCGCSNSFFS